MLAKICRFSAVLLSLLCLARLPVVAQVSAGLSGRVTDQTGAAVPRATVAAISDETGSSRITVTDSTGVYGLTALPIGHYELRAEKNGFAMQIRTGIVLVVGQEATADLTLQVGKVNEQVKVVADVPVVNTSTQDISGLVGEKEVKALPLNGRSFDLLLTLNPGIVNFTWEKTGGIGVSNSTTGNNFSASGNRPQQNLFLLNGVEFTGAAENNMQPGGPSQDLLGVEAVREFNVLRDSYGAEYGKRPGAQVSIVTQSGSNQLHGSVYEYLRDNALDAPNYFDQASAPPFQRNQFGASLGGPIHKDKTFFFANYEGFIQDLHQTSVAFVPDLASRAAAAHNIQPLLNLWITPPANAPDFNGIAQVFSSPLQTIHEDFGNARVDNIFSQKDNFSAIDTVDDGRDFTPTAGNPYSADVLTLREQVASLEETHVFSPSLLTTARFGYSRAGYFFTGEPTPGTPAADVPGFLLGHPVGAIVVGGSAASNPQAQIGLAGSNNGSNLTIARNLYTYEDRVSWTRGIHQFSFGAWFQQFQSNENIALSQYGQATFTGLKTFLAGTTASFLYDPSPTKMNWRSLFSAFYAQDVIRLRPSLTLTLGFRGEMSTGWNEAHGRAANYTYSEGVISNQPRIASSAFTANNARSLPEPRIGLAWSPASGTVLQTGFGIYNELQDALGYRMDQNAPFNPSYSIAAFPVSQLPINPLGSVPAKALLVPGGTQPDLKMPTLISYSFGIEQEITPNTSLTVRYLGSHGYHELIGVDANQPVPTVCPASPCPAVYPSNFPAPLAGSPVPAGSYYIPAETPRANPTLANTWTWFSVANSSYNALQVDFHHRFSHGLSFRGAYTWSKTLDDGDSLNGTAAANAPALVANPYDLHADWGLATYDVRHVGVISAVYELPLGNGKRFASHLGGFGNGLAGGWSVNSIVVLQGGFPFTTQLSYNPSNNGDTRNPVRPFVNPNFTGAVITGDPGQWFNPNAFLAPPANSGFYGNLGRDTLIGPGLATWDFSAVKDTRVSERIDLQFRAEIFNLLDRSNFNTPNLITFTPSGVSGTAGAITSTSTSARQIQFALKALW
ncbi:MAG: carboxypeptidase-like regulatory domain-containing protein [Acidobacteriaceae bacterium]